MKETVLLKKMVKSDLIEEVKSLNKLLFKANSEVQNYKRLNESWFQDGELANKRHNEAVKSLKNMSDRFNICKDACHSHEAFIDKLSNERDAIMKDYEDCSNVCSKLKNDKKELDREIAWLKQIISHITKVGDGQK